MRPNLPCDPSPGSAHCKVSGCRGGSGGRREQTHTPMARRTPPAACLRRVPRAPVQDPMTEACVPPVSTPGEAFDPRSLVIAARLQHPELPALARALARCTARWPENDHSDTLVPPERAHLCNVLPQIYLLEHHAWGGLAIHVVRDREAPEGLTVVCLSYPDRMPDDETPDADPDDVIPLSPDAP